LLRKRFLLLISFLLIFSILFFLPLVSAADFSVNYETIDNDIFPEELAEYKLIIKNNEPHPITVRVLFSDQSSWRLRTDPLTHLSGIDIPVGGTVISRIIVKPLKPFKYGSSLIPITVRASDETSREIEVPFLLRNPFLSSGYIPSINVDIDLPRPVDPREDTKIDVTLHSKNPLNLTGLVIKLTSSLYNDERITDLPPLEKITESFMVNLPDATPPQESILNVEVFFINNSYARSRKPFIIKAYSNIAETKDKIDNFLKDTTVIRLNNTGNARGGMAYRTLSPFFEHIFTSTSPKASYEKYEGQNYLMWDVSLNSGEVIELKVVVNYRQLVLSVLLVVLAIASYYYLRSPLVIRKEAVREGSSSYKLLLHIKNRTKNVVDNITVIDKVPSLLDVVRRFPVGTLHPTKIVKHEKIGTMLKWELPVLESYEERIITYHIDSNLQFVGQFSLPRARVKFKNKRGKLATIKSKGLSV